MTEARRRFRHAPLAQIGGMAALLLPAAFGAAFILDRFALSNAVLAEVTRPLVVAALGGTILALAVWTLLRDRGLAALLASALLLAFALHVVPALVLTGLTAWRAAFRIGPVRRRSGRFLGTTSAPVQVASVYAVILLVAGAWTSADALTVSIADPPVLPPATGSEPGPNVYLLLLDGYPRADTLEADFGFDNSPFLAELDGLGFEVAAGAQSNHNKTWLTTATLFNGEYVAELPEIVDFPRASQPQVRLAHILINNAAALDRMRDHGYRIVSIPSPLVSTDITSNAEVRTDGHLNGFEISLASRILPAHVAPGAVLSFLAGGARQMAISQLDAIADASEAGPPDGAAAQVVLAHVMPPHPPLVLGQEPDYLAECFPGCSIWESTPEGMGISDTEYADRTATQVAELNRLVIDALERVVEADPDAIVVVLSDHGVRRHEEADDEHFRILFAARTPEHPNLFTGDQAPVNVFRRILSTVLDEPLPDLPYRAWASDWDWPLEVDELD